MDVIVTMIYSMMSNTRTLLYSRAITWLIPLIVVIIYSIYKLFTSLGGKYIFTKRMSAQYLFSLSVPRVRLA